MRRATALVLWLGSSPTYLVRQLVWGEALESLGSQWSGLRETSCLDGGDLLVAAAEGHKRLHERVDASLARQRALESVRQMQYSQSSVRPTA
jgi:hypothetical protein